MESASLGNGQPQAIAGNNQRQGQQQNLTGLRGVASGASRVIVPAAKVVAGAATGAFAGFGLESVIVRTAEGNFRAGPLSIMTTMAGTVYGLYRGMSGVQQNRAQGNQPPALDEEGDNQV